jgi:hypothetical protein
MSSFGAEHLLIAAAAPHSIIGTGLHVITSVLNLPSGIASGAASAIAGAGLNAISGWVLGGTAAALREVAQIIGRVTTPALGSSWFSATYWRVAGLAALLTVPFLFAAAIQAVIRSEPAMLVRAAFVDLPLALIGVALAAPLVTLLLAATDQMSRVVSAVGVNGGARFLDKAADIAVNASAIDGSPFFAVVIGLFLLGAAIALTLELLIREAAVYVVVLMLPLAFSALVWPARRIWAARLVELLIALILSKFVIVAVLSLAGAALGQAGAGPSILLPAMALVFLATFSPWAVLRILPFAELAAGAAGSMRSGMPSAGPVKDHLLKRATGLGEAEALSLPEPLTVARPFGNDPPEGGPLRQTGGRGRDGRGGDTLGGPELTPAAASFGHAPTSQTSTSQASASQTSTSTGSQPAVIDYAAVEHAGGGGGKAVGTGAQPARPSSGEEPHSEPAPPSYDEVPPYKKPGLVVLGGPTGAYHVPDPKQAGRSDDDDLPPLSAPSDPL